MAKKSVSEESATVFETLDASAAPAQPKATYKDPNHDRKAMFERYPAQPNPLAGKQVIGVVV